MGIGENLRKLRQISNMTLEEAGKKVGITKQTMFKYETGIVTNIPIPNIEKLAKLYSVHPAQIMGWTDEQPSETTPIKLAPIYQTRRRLALAYNAINDEGQVRVADYAEDLQISGRYDRDSLPLSEEIQQYITIVGSAAAGNGFLYGDDYEQYRLITTTDIPEHDFAIEVNGDSMFHTIFDGDIAFIVEAYDQVNKDIYLLDIDGETVIKRVVFTEGGIELLSDNPDWKVRTLTDAQLQNTKILGRVVGWESAV